MATCRNIFISHSSKDKQFARMLTNHLSEYGIEVWLDETELLLGDFLTERIRDAIEQVDYLAIILSSYSLRSDWVRKELEIALEKEKQLRSTLVVPILLDNIDIPQTLQDRVYADFIDQGMYHKGFHDGHQLERQEQLIIFSDARKLGWENWSWDCDCDEKSTRYVRGGQYSMSVTLRGFGGLAFAFRSGIETEGYRKLEFYINGGDVGGQQLKVYVNDKLGNGIRKPVALEKLSPQEWKLISIPLPDLDAENIIICKINISDTPGQSTPTFFLDDLSLVA